MNYELWLFLKEFCQYSDYCRQASEKYLNGNADEDSQIYVCTSLLNEDLAAIDISRNLMIDWTSELTLAITEYEAPTAITILAWYCTGLLDINICYSISVLF